MKPGSDQMSSGAESTGSAVRRCASLSLAGFVRLLLMRVTRRKVFPSSFEEWRYAQVSFSQFGEDIAIARILGKELFRADAWFVDVGAYDPVVYSNTLLLTTLGWMGVNVDPHPEAQSRFARLRPNQINLGVAVGREAGKRTFVCYPERATGRLRERDVEPSASVLGEEPSATFDVDVETLAAILCRCLPAGCFFGLLNVDCEGGDLDVLRSNDWGRFRPRVIAVEDHEPGANTPVDNYMRDVHYSMVERLCLTKLFVDATGSG